MKKILCWLMLCYTMIIILSPIGVIAATTDLVQITCTGVSTLGISNFTVVASNFSEDNEGVPWFQADGSWNNPENIDYVLIRMDFDDYPNTITDGHLVYQGTSESFTQTVSGVVEQVYYSAWVYYSGEYSTPVNYLLEVESSMVNVMTLGIFALLALAPSIAFFATRQGLLAIIAAAGWLFLGVFCYTESSETWDINYSIAFFSLFMVILFVVSSSRFYYSIRQQKLIDASEDDWGDDEPLRQSILAEENEDKRMDRLFGKSKGKKKPVQKKNNRFNQTGEL